MSARLSLAIVIFASVLPVAARAQAADPALAEGRREFDVGEKEFNLGHLAAALEHFERSYRLTGRAALLLNLGHTAKKLYDQTRRQELLPEAIQRFKAYLATTGGDGDPRVAAQRARAEAELKESEEAWAREEAARATGEESLALGERLVVEGKLDEAEAQLARYLGSPGNERPGVVRAELLTASLRLARADRPGAVLAYARALSLDRSVVLAPSASEAARDAFAQAMVRIGSSEVVRVIHEPPGSIRIGAPLTLNFSATSDPFKLVRGVEVRYRAGRGAFSTLPTAPLGKVAVPREFVATLLPGAHFEYYVDVVDERGARLQHLGTSEAPFSASVEQPSGPSIAKRWWFWTAVGGTLAVAGAGVGLGLYLTRPPPPTQVAIPAFGSLQ